MIHQGSNPNPSLPDGDAAPQPLKGVYNDRLSDSKGRYLWESGWRNNLVVKSCNILLATLMKRQPGHSGILYWAVGAGSEDWDDLTPSPNANDRKLFNEIARKDLALEQIQYLDEEDHVTETPSSGLQITATFRYEDLGGQDPRVLREFGLFGGDATAEANSGWMIDAIIHPRIPLSPGLSLTRNLRLSFGGGVGAGEAVGGMGQTLPVISIDGVGRRYGSILSAAGVNTVGDLLGIDPLLPMRTIPPVKLREFRAKARLVLGFRVNVSPFMFLAQRSLSDLLKSDPETLASEISSPAVTPENVIGLQESLALLQVALDDAALQEITLGNLLAS